MSSSRAEPHPTPEMGWQLLDAVHDLEAAAARGDEPTLLAGRATALAAVVNRQPVAFDDIDTWERAVDVLAAAGRTGEFRAMVPRIVHPHLHRAWMIGVDTDYADGDWISRIAPAGSFVDMPWLWAVTQIPTVDSSPATPAKVRTELRALCAHIDARIDPRPGIATSDRAREWRRRGNSAALPLARALASPAVTAGQRFRGARVLAALMQLHLDPDVDRAETLINEPAEFHSWALEFDAAVRDAVHDFDRRFALMQAAVAAGRGFSDAPGLAPYPLRHNRYPRLDPGDVDVYFVKLADAPATRFDEYAGPLLSTLRDPSRDTTKLLPEELRHVDRIEHLVAARFLGIPMHDLGHPDPRLRTPLSWVYSDNLYRYWLENYNAGDFADQASGSFERDWLITARGGEFTNVRTSSDGTVVNAPGLMPYLPSGQKTIIASRGEAADMIEAIAAHTARPDHPLTGTMGAKATADYSDRIAHTLTHHHVLRQFHPAERHRLYTLLAAAAAGKQLPRPAWLAVTDRAYHQRWLDDTFAPDPTPSQAHVSDPTHPAYYAARGVPRQSERELRADFAIAYQLRQEAEAAFDQRDWPRHSQLSRQASEIQYRWCDRDDEQGACARYLRSVISEWHRSPGFMAAGHPYRDCELTDASQWRSHQHARELAGYGEWCPDPDHRLVVDMNTGQGADLELAAQAAHRLRLTAPSPGSPQPAEMNNVDNRSAPALEPGE
ncbi:hypothetical protein ACWDUL_20810 [Nocardia niigatensis]